MKIVLEAKEAVQNIESNMNVFVHGGSATPTLLIDALVYETKAIKDLNFFHLHTHGNAPYAQRIFQSRFHTFNFFVGKNMREHLNYKSVDYIPCFLSEIPDLFIEQVISLDACLIQVSPPDHHGYCTLGTSVDVAISAINSAKTIIAHINPKMPRMHGDGFIHVSKIDFAFERSVDLPESPSTNLSKIEHLIGSHIASVVDNGSTLQMGIGSIPDAALEALKGHKHLGIHTEMFSNKCMELIQAGTVDNINKHIHPGKTVSSFVIGTKRLYEFIDDNPSIVLLDIAYVNDPRVISRNPSVVAINGAIEVDLTGQVCADSIGHHIVSGVGGQMDFIQGARWSKGGKSIIAMASRTQKGVSKIVNFLSQGAGVVTTRNHVDCVATEYGIVHLKGKPLSQRAKDLINIAHPEDREDLEKSWLSRSKH